MCSEITKIYECSINSILLYDKDNLGYIRLVLIAEYIRGATDSDIMDS